MWRIIIREAWETFLVLVICAALVACVFLAASYASGQEVPPVKSLPTTPEVPPIKQWFPSYLDEVGKPGLLITFIGCEPRNVDYLTACRVHALSGYPAKAVVVSKDGYWLATLPCGASDKEIRIAAGLERPVSASPFPSSRAVGLIASPDGSRYHAGHACPGCGTRQYAISGYNRDGTHNHSCPRCGTTWRH